MHINLMRKYYFINKFDTNNIDRLDKKTIIIFRDYNSRNQNENLILKIHKYCKNIDPKNKKGLSNKEFGLFLNLK